MEYHSGLGMNMANLAYLSKAETRSISPENPTGEPGRGGRASDGTGARASRDLGVGWKVSPSISLKAGSRQTIADIEGPGAIQHIWLTPTGMWRHLILRFYWDDQKHPSIECPVGDFFANGWGRYAQVSSLAVCVNPLSGLNSYWEMPFRGRARLEVENIGNDDAVLYYQITYTLTDVPENIGYLHAHFRRSNPLPYKDVHTVLERAEGEGHYVGTYIAWGVNNTGWWGEGEIKFYLDDDHEYPTICGTGTEDYFGGSYDFDLGLEKVPGREGAGYQEFTTPYSGLSQVIRPDGRYDSQQRFSMYRWHITDPIRFRQRLSVTIQALGWRGGGRYLPLQDDISSVAYWYQSLPSKPLSPLPDPDYLEIV